VLRSAIKRSAAWYDTVRRPQPGVVVLIYHRVGGGSGLEVDLERDVFDAQMHEVASRAVTLDAGLVAMASSPAGGADPVVVSFDDGTADFAEHALPVLVRHGVPVVLYLATRFVEEQQEFPGDGRPLSWAALHDCVSTGLVTIGSHTHSHALLDRCSPATLEHELDRSIELIRDRLGIDPVHFAYPKAVDGSPQARNAVARRFRSAALAGTRANPYGHTDPHRLARSPIQVSDGMQWFRRKLAGGMRAEDRIRRAVNRVRYARAST
jgi:peptidoglycan/xylan/chitin deacetylase (PgdA/CDA1 family)